MVKEDGVNANISIGEMFDTFGDHGYDLWDAIFELVDNSVDSFVKNKTKIVSCVVELFDISGDLHICYNVTN